MIAYLLASASAQPFQVDLAVDGPLTLATGAIWMGLYLGAHRQVDQIDAEPARLPRGIDSLASLTLHEGFARASDVLLYGSFGGAFVANIAEGWKDQPSGRALMVAEAFAINGVLTELVKYAVRRPRPYTYDHREGIGDDLSFFSGHSSFVAAAGFTTARSIDISGAASPQLRAGLYGGATVLALATAALRVAAGKHYPSDVLVGLAVGASVGFLVPELHRSERFQTTAMPTTGGGQLRFSGRW